jgi:hypothetical protein
MNDCVDEVEAPATQGRMKQRRLGLEQGANRISRILATFEKNQVTSTCIQSPWLLPVNVQHHHNHNHHHHHHQDGLWLDAAIMIQSARRRMQAKAKVEVMRDNQATTTCI